MVLGPWEILHHRLLSPTCAVPSAQGGRAWRRKPSKLSALPWQGCFPSQVRHLCPMPVVLHRVSWASVWVPLGVAIHPPALQPQSEPQSSGAASASCPAPAFPRDSHAGLLVVPSLVPASPFTAQTLPRAPGPSAWHPGDTPTQMGQGVSLPSWSLPPSPGPRLALLQDCQGGLSTPALVAAVGVLLPPSA